MASRRGIVLVLVSAASLASIAAPPPLITSGRLVLKTASQSFAGRGLVVRTPRVLDNRRERRLVVGARLDPGKARDIADKMKKAGWQWPMTDVFQNYDWDNIRKDLEMEPLDAFSMVVSVTIYLRAALYLGATVAAAKLAEGFPVESVWSYAMAACAGYFGVGVFRQLWLLRLQSALIEDLQSETNVEPLVREALRLLKDSDSEFSVREEMKGLGAEGMLEWDPDGVLPSRGGEGEDEGLIAAMEKRRGEFAANKFKEKIVTSVRSAVNEKPEMQGAASTLSSLDSLMVGYTGDDDPQITAESLGVNKDLLSAARKIFQRYDDLGTGELRIPQIREMAMTYELNLPSDKEVSYFAQSLGASPEGALSKKAFLEFWAENERKATSSFPEPPETQRM